MKLKGAKFTAGKVDEWLDCGNKNATVHTNSRVLEHIKNSEQLIDPTVKIENSIIIEPCYIGPGSSIINSVIGPHVSIENNTQIENARITNSMIQANTKINKKLINNSMIGSQVLLQGAFQDYSLGDYNQVTTDV